MKLENSEDLLVIISMQDDEPNAAKDAFEEFYQRYNKFVWKTCFKLCGNLQSFKAEELLQDVFLDVYNNYDKTSYFDADKHKNIESGIKFWLVGIIKNHLKRYFEECSKLSNIDYGDSFPDRPFFDLPIKNELFDSPKMILIERALDSLKPRDREILLISMNFEDEGKLPKEIKQTLCKVYGLLPDSLRQIKRRARKKVEDFIANHSKTTQIKING